MRAFIIRPFNAKDGIDFERTEAELIDPALTALKIDGRTTGEILEAGNIRVDMFQQLLVADLVVADISIHNPNVFYELGIRHALQARRTFLIRGKTAGVESRDVPFDLKTDRYMEYDAQNPGHALAKLIAGLKQTLASDKKDSPVFCALPNLEAEDRSSFIVVPPGFLEDVETAAALGDGARLALLSYEARGFSWELEGLRVVGRAQFKQKDFRPAKTTWEAIRELDPGDVEANQMLATIEQRLGDLVASNKSIDRVMANNSLDRSDRGEAYALRARNAKDLWLREWRSLETAPLRQQAALKSPHLFEAYKSYEQAFLEDLNKFYPAVNALALLVTILELAAKIPEVWTKRFRNERESRDQLEQFQTQRERLKGALRLCLDSKRNDKGELYRWREVTEADFCFLTDASPEVVFTTYNTLARKLIPFEIDAIRRQLEIYKDLGVFTQTIDQALSALPSGGQQGGKPASAHVILFSGHRIDTPGRTKPRFPQACEESARVAIREAIENERSLFEGDMLGMAGGASGSDILFHEECRKLGIPTRLLLALPPDQYARESVDEAGITWSRRFQQLLRQSEPRVLAETKTLPLWLEQKSDYGVWQRNNLWMLSEAIASGAPSISVIVFWNGERGDGPGGTEDMLRLAKEHGRTTILVSRTICGLD